MSRTIPIAVAVLSVWGTASVALGQQSPTQPRDTAIFRLGEIIVQAVRPVTTTGGASAIEIRVDSLRTQPAPTLEQLLRQIPLVQVRTNSRGEAQFSLRGSGSDARQVAVLVDGVPLSLGWDDRADLSVIPTTAAQSLTLARGLPSVLYGPNVLGGVVEVGVARGVARAMIPRAFRLDAGIDHLGSRALAGAVTMPWRSGSGEFLLRAGLGARQRHGIALPHGVTEPVATSDPDLRLNTDLDHVDGFTAFRYQAQRGGWASFSTSAFHAQRGIPAELHVLNARYWRYPEIWRALTVISGGTGQRRSPFGGSGDIESSFGVDLGHAEIDQYDTRDYQQIIAEEDADDRTFTWRFLADQTAGENGELRAALTYADINHDEVLTPGGNASYRQRLWSGALEMVWRLSGTRISLGSAVDGADTPESGDKPPLDRLWEWGGRAGVTSVVAKSHVLLHAGISRRARFPALRELYSGALGRFEPNPHLRPEKLVAAEVGATTKFGRGELQAVLFHHVLSDAIVRMSTATGRFQRVNRDRHQATGLELLGTMSIAGATFSADLTLQSSKLEDPSADTEVEPEYQPNVLGGLRISAPMPLELRLDAAAKYTGKQYCVNPESQQQNVLSAVGRFDGELGRIWRVRAGWVNYIDASVAADNITDQAVYDQCGLPQAGRTFRFQVRLR